MLLCAWATPESSNAGIPNRCHFICFIFMIPFRDMVERLAHNVDRTSVACALRLRIDAKWTMQSRWRLFSPRRSTLKLRFSGNAIGFCAPVFGGVSLTARRVGRDSVVFRYV